MNVLQREQKRRPDHLRGFYPRHSPSLVVPPPLQHRHRHRQRTLASLLSLSHTFNFRAPTQCTHSSPLAHTSRSITWNHPIGEIAIFRDLHSSQNSQIDVATTDHCKRVIAREKRSAWQNGHCLLPSIDQIWILLPCFREWSFGSFDFKSVCAIGG